MKIYRNYFKRLIDISFSFAALVILSPLFLIIIVLIKVTSKGPIIFTQRRIGIHKSYFNIFKFRTMYIDTPKDVPTHLLEKPEQYITNFGHFLRKTSLDELPQIWQILIGKMSIVGPRPALWNQYDLIELRDKYNANDVLPGLTGWAQINGRDELSIYKKVMFDRDYIKNMSFLFDYKCIYKTVSKVLKKEGFAEGVAGVKYRHDGIKKEQ